LLRLLLLALFFVLVARSFWRFIEGVARGAGMPPPGPGGAGPRAPVPVKIMPCAVCGTYVVPGKSLSTTTLRGQPVYFCSEKCRADYREQ
jgi:hypothetical protein